MALLHLLVLGLASFVSPAHATVVAAALLPHGDIALDPSREPSLNATQRKPGSCAMRRCRRAACFRGPHQTWSS